MVLVGLLSPELSFSSPTVIRRQLDILGSYGGNYSNMEACLDLIAKGLLVPQVVEGNMKDFPTILDDLHHGKVKGRVVLVPEDVKNV